MNFELERGIAEVIISQLEPMREAVTKKKLEIETLEEMISKNREFISVTEEYISNVEKLKNQYDAQVSE